MHAETLKTFDLTGTGSNLAESPEAKTSRLRHVPKSPAHIFQPDRRVQSRRYAHHVRSFVRIRPLERSG